MKCSKVAEKDLNIFTTSKRSDGNGITRNFAPFLAAKLIKCSKIAEKDLNILRTS